MAGLSIVQIANFLQIDRSSARRIAANNCKLIKNDRYHVSIPTDEFVVFICTNSYYRKQFKQNFDSRIIAPKYLVSARIIMDKILEKECKMIESENLLLTTKDVLSIVPFSIFKNRESICQACQQRKLLSFKYKTKKGQAAQFGRWMIPIDGLALFLKTNPIYEQDFNHLLDENLNSWKERNEQLFKLGTVIQNAMNRLDNVGNEEFTVHDLSYILNIPINQVEAIFFSSSLLEKIRGKISKSVTVPMDEFLNYILAEPDRKTALYDRWQDMAQTKHPLEGKVRHALMLCEYRENLRKKD